MKDKKKKKKEDKKKKKKKDKKKRKRIQIWERWNGSKEEEMKEGKEV